MFKNTFRMTAAIGLLVSMGHLVVKAATPARQLEDFGSRTKQSPKSSFRKSTKHPMNGERECARRRTQIALGQLKVSA